MASEAKAASAVIRKYCGKGSDSEPCSHRVSSTSGQMSARGMHQERRLADGAKTYEEWLELEARIAKCEEHLELAKQALENGVPLAKPNSAAHPRFVNLVTDDVVVSESEEEVEEQKAEVGKGKKGMPGQTRNVDCTNARNAAAETVTVSKKRTKRDDDLPEAPQTSGPWKKRMAAIAVSAAAVAALHPDAIPSAQTLTAVSSAAIPAFQFVESTVYEAVVTAASALI